jgi:hypothetical protein
MIISNVCSSMRLLNYLNISLFSSYHMFLKCFVFCVDCLPHFSIFRKFSHAGMSFFMKSIEPKKLLEVVLYFKLSFEITCLMKLCLVLARGQCL